MWWVFSALLALIVWATWYIFKLPLWLPIVGTILVVLAGVVRLLWSRIRASRGASALERAIAHQGAQQALNARPERRAEIQELQKQVQGGINALKTSKLGKGKKGGAAALYSLPWYVIIGPPGAGKTTALKHSGLVFPFSDPRGGGVRGVGGTRNCDWWFTNEAILLDTAGRYTTEGDDHDEWISFLQMLKRYRSRKPINGVLIAINIAELIDASEQQIESTGKKLRARIDEVMTQLQMVVPVYLLFTKCDLVAGFIEFFGDIRKSDRAQAWGATIKLAEDKANPGAVFEREFDVLVQKVHSRSLKRLSQERNREARERIYQFPLEYAGIRRNLTELVQTIFAVNSFQGTPLFRGFYFTSGTQEGRPLDRVLGRMGQAMGIRPPEAAAQQVTESKSYFLHDVFMNVVFPDGDVAARSAAELKRQRIMRIAVSGAAFTLGFILAIPSCQSFMANRELLSTTHARVATATKINWADGESPGPKLDQIDPLYARLKELDEHATKGVPLSLGWGMYRGDRIARPSVTAYVQLLSHGFVLPCKAKLEERLQAAKGKQYLKERTTLKTYLMMSDVKNMNIEEETRLLTNLWADLLRATSTMAEFELKDKLKVHVKYYLELVVAGKVTPPPPNLALVNQVRETLKAVPVQERYYELFINSINDVVYDEASEASRGNRRYRPLTIKDFYVDRPDALKFIKSARELKEGRLKEVEGAYTDDGHYVVALNVANAAGLLESEQWVIPLGPEEQGDRIPVNLKRLAEDYDQRYIEQWTDFLADITVDPPKTVKEAIDLYDMLRRPPMPYLKILREIEDHTQWKKSKKDGGASVNKDEANRMLNQKLQQRFAQSTGGLRIKTDFDVTKLGERPSTVPSTFAKLISFSLSESKGSQQVITDTPLQKYIDILTELRRQMDNFAQPPTPTDMLNLSEQAEDAAKKVEALLLPLDEKAKALLRPLLHNPLHVQGTRLAKAGGGNYVAVKKEKYPNPFKR